jgi:hypoxanthine-DNA glycosylase
LILGSLPGDASLAQSRYYGHPQNAFWRLVGRAIDVDLASLDYEARLEALKAGRIALWDVIAEAHRPGSLDGAIRRERANDLAGLIESLPDLQAIAFNGGTAARLGTKALAGVRPDIERIALPSSSPAYTLSFDKKAAAWMALRTPLGITRDV